MNLWIRGSVRSMGIQAICKDDGFGGGKMKDLLAPRTAMRHHSQRGPEAEGERGSEGGGRADSEEQRERNARRRLNFLSRRRRSEDGSPLLIPRPSVWESPFLASHTLLNSLLLCFSPAISQTTRQLTTREKRSVSLPSASAIRGSFSRSGEFLQC